MPDNWRAIQGPSSWTLTRTPSVLLCWGLYQGAAMPSLGCPCPHFCTWPDHPSPWNCQQQATIDNSTAQWCGVWFLETIGAVLKMWVEGFFISCCFLTPLLKTKQNTTTTTNSQKRNKHTKKTGLEKKSKNKHFCKTSTLIWMQGTLWPSPGSWFYLLTLFTHFVSKP